MVMARLLSVTGLLAALVLPLAAEELALDRFDYPDVAAARAAWKPAEKSQPADLEAHDNGTALKLVCDFQQNDRRAVYDRVGKWDLTPYNRLSFQLRTPVPAALRVFILYLRSGDGWFYTQCNTNGREWQTVDVAKAAFSPEDKPAGWHDITGIRLSAWRGAAVDSYCLVDNLTAWRDRVVLLKADTRNSTEEYVEELLRGYGTRVRVLREAEFQRDPAGEPAVFILACNPNLAAATCQKLAGCVQAGGKLIVFRYLPPPLAELLHLRVTTDASNTDTAEPRQIRCSAGAVKGLPEILALSLSAVTAVEPVDGGATVLGRWCDAEGRDRAGAAAVLLAPAGVFVGATLAAGDGLDNGRLVLALLSHVAPEVGLAAGQAAAESAVQIGHLSRGQLPDWVASHSPDAKRREQARVALAAASGCEADIASALQAGEGLAAADEGLRRNRDLEAAYLLAQRSRPGEFRAWWEHSGTGGYPGGWEQAMSALAGGGFNAVIANCLRGGSALYPSQLLPVLPEVARRGDQIAAAVAAGRKYGVEMHIWKVCFWGWDTPRDFTDKMRAAGRLQVSRGGETNEWLCPSHPENRELEVASMVEVASSYPVAGVHFDYIRYPGPEYCFCAGCRSRFSQDTGIAISAWPADVDKPEVAAAWTAWRAEQITAIVRETARRVRQVRPECKISAAVFADYPGCMKSVGQDWVRWAKEGDVDFLCPMDYSSSDATFAQQVASQLRYLDGAAPIYPGIHASTLTLLPFAAARVASQINVARQLGADGFTVFNLGAALGDKFLPGLRSGITAEPTYVPHHGPRLTFQLSGTPDGKQRAIRVTPGEAVRCTIRRLEPKSASFAGTVVVENPDGDVIRELGRLGSSQAEAEFSFTLEPVGLYRVAVRGEAAGPGGGPKRPFTARSQGLICGPLDPAMAALLGAE
jgi:uncharacterized lipoprotein YddW (UPF0748 family)